jgi:hypothetical protein
MSTAASGKEFATRAACRYELRNPRLSRSSAEYSEASRGSLHESACRAPPSGLAISTWYPRWVNSQYRRANSAHQNPIGHPVCSDTDQHGDLLGATRGTGGVVELRVGVWLARQTIAPSAFRVRPSRPATGSGGLLCRSTATFPTYVGYEACVASGNKFAQQGVLHAASVATIGRPAHRGDSGSVLALPARDSPRSSVPPGRQGGVEPRQIDNPAMSRGNDE